MKRVSVISMFVALIAGCQSPVQRLNSPPQGHSGCPSPMQKHYTASVDNAALADMSVADIDFAGPGAELNGTGLAQMERLVKVLRQHGGELRYSTDLTDQKLVQARINRLEDYLASAGLDMTKVSVHADMPASMGMTAGEAIKAQEAPMGGEGDKGGATAEAGGNGGAGKGMMGSMGGGVK